MNVNFYNFSKRPNSTKRPTGNGTIYQCTLIEENTSIISPTLKLKLPTGESFINKNYCYIADFERYYFVSDVSYNLGVWFISLNCDVLATAKNIIGASTQYVMRSSSLFDGDIIDTAYPTKTEQEYEQFTSDYGSIWGTTDPCFIVGIIGGMDLSPSSAVMYNYNGSVIYYVLTHDQLYQFILTLLSRIDLYSVSNSEMSQALQKQLLNPIQYIHSIKCVPFTPSTSLTETSFIYVGFTKMNIQDIILP